MNSLVSIWIGLIYVYLDSGSAWLNNIKWFNYGHNFFNLTYFVDFLYRFTWNNFVRSLSNKALILSAPWLKTAQHSRIAPITTHQWFDMNSIWWHFKSSNDKIFLTLYLIQKWKRDLNKLFGWKKNYSYIITPQY